MTEHVSTLHPHSDQVPGPVPAEMDAPMTPVAGVTNEPSGHPTDGVHESTPESTEMVETQEGEAGLPESETAETEASAMPTEDVSTEEGLESAVAEAEVDEHAKHWYVVKVQSGREDSIKEAIERRVRKEGLEESFGQIVIPVEKVTEVKVDKNGKRVAKTRERKLYPGYLMVEVEYNDKIVYLFRETSGVGDFVGAHPHDLTKAPTPMSEREVQRMLGPTHGTTPEQGKSASAPLAPKPKWLQEGDRVKVVDGTFNGMDGVVKQILEATSKVQVELSIFGRPVAIELEYYQVEQL